VPVTSASSFADATAPRSAVGPRRRLPDGFELGVLALLAALSMWVVATDLVEAARHHLVWTHTDGFFSGDQLQYLSWIQSSSQSFLIANLFVLRSTPADYFQPAIVVSGLLTRLGIAPWLALMLWKPVAVVGLFAAVRAAAHRMFDLTSDRRAALVLGLLFASLSAVYGSLGVIGDEMTMWLSWGYPFALMAVALIVFGMLAYARARDAGRWAWGPGLLGAVAGSLHPWQGELFILVLVGAELARAPQTLRDLRAGAAGAETVARSGTRWLRDPRTRLALGTIALTAVPLLYYLILGRLDVNWGMARQHSKHAFSFTAIAIGFAPLAVFAALAYRGRPANFLELLMRAWVPAALVIYVLSATALSATPLHAFNGITVPLAMLAVTGARRTGLTRIPRGRVVAVVAVLLGIVPGNVYTMAYAHEYTSPTVGNADYIHPSENEALKYLAASPIPGGVLSRFYLGEALAGLTGRRDFTGDCLWSEPRCLPRASAADSLFAGRMTPAAARRFVSQSGARFLLAGCQRHVDLRRWLGSLLAATHTFGCATVYELVTPGPPRGPFVRIHARRHRA
jgi:hypothetical protein